MGNEMFQTKYCNLSSNDFLLLLTTEKYKKLSTEDRLLVFQEFENRQADAVGRKRCHVVVEKMDNDNLIGYCNGEVIAINEIVALGGKFTRYTQADIIETLIHEGRHAFQMHAVTTDDTRVDKIVKLMWLIGLRVAYYNGTSGDYALYASQAIEIDARREAREQVRAINAKLKELTGRTEYDWMIKAEKLDKQEIENLKLYKTISPEMLDQLERELLQLIDDSIDGLEEYYPEFDRDSFRYFYAIYEMLQSGVKPDRSLLQRIDRMFRADFPDSRFYENKVDRVDRIDKPDLLNFRAASRSL